MKKEKSFQNLILFTVLVFSLYYFYRYLFKYNSEVTSPTYSDTPATFQLAKYVIAIAVLAALFVLLYISESKIRFRWPEILIAFGMGYAIIKTVQQGSYDLFIKNFLFIAVAYGVFFIQDDSFQNRFINLNKLIFIYHALYSFLQIALYLIVGRLPALAFENGLVRFGGGWDDPNAFALYLIMPYVYSMSRILSTQSNKNQLGSYAVMLLSVMLEVLTFSFTGYICFALASLIIIWKFRHSKKMRIILACGICLAVIGVIVLFDKIVEILNFKSGSLAIHFESLSLRTDGTLFGALFGSGEYSFFENYYNILAYNYGVIYMLIAVCLFVYFIAVGYRVQKHYSKNNLFFACFIFIFVYSVCQLALPYSIIFPVNYFYWIAVFWTLKEYRKIACEKALTYPRAVNVVSEVVSTNEI